MRPKSFIGCALLGCLGLPVLAALVLGGFVLVTEMNEMPSEPRSESFEEELPGTEPLTGQGTAGLRDESPSGLEIPVRRESGLLHLDVAAAELRIEPIAADRPLRVEADYDRGAFELRKEMIRGDEGWEYRIEFGPRSWLRSFQRERLDNRIWIGIPEGTPLRIEGRVRLCENDMELGGLSLVALDLEAGLGEHVIGFSRPTPEPMELFRIEASVGELDLFDLGNGSPRTLEVSQNIGELSVGLEGAWRDDATARVRLGIGELHVERPRSARVEVRGPRVRIGEARAPSRRPQEEDESLPLVVLDVEGTMGEISVD